MIVMAVSGGVIVAGLAWAGLHDYRRRGRGARASVAEKFNRQAEIDRQRLREAAPGGDGGAARLRLVMWRGGIRRKKASGGVPTPPRKDDLFPKSHGWKRSVLSIYWLGRSIYWLGSKGTEPHARPQLGNDLCAISQSAGSQPRLLPESRSSARSVPA